MRRPVPTNAARPSPPPSMTMPPPPPGPGGGPVGARPRAARPPAPPPRRPDGLLDRLRDAGEALWSPRGGRLFHEFADVVALARQPEAVEAALVRMAGAVAGAARVELLLDRDVATQPAPKRVALWPESASAMTAAEVEALGYPLCLGLWCGDHYQMTLQLYARPGRGGRWPRRVVRALTTLCAVAAAAERGMHVNRRARLETPADMNASVRDATFLNAILPYALAQAHRHREPLTIFCLEVDRLAEVAKAHGPERADAAVRRVAEAVGRTLRGSDVVARLDDDRVVVVLPNTGSADALTVAEVARTAAVGACRPVGVLPELSVSVGVACFPEDGQEMVALLHAADEAMTRARASGRNRIASASPPPKLKPATVAG